MTTENLHACFDGELGRDEATRVARELSAQPELAARLAEIKGIDAALDALPAHTPSADFVDRVVRAAEVDGALDTLPAHPGSEAFTARVVGAVRRKRVGALLVRIAAPVAAAAVVLLAVWLGPDTQPPLPAPDTGYAWESDLETFGSLSLTEREDEILMELEAT